MADSNCYYDWTQLSLGWSYARDPRDSNNGEYGLQYVELTAPEERSVSRWASLSTLENAAHNKAQQHNVFRRAALRQLAKCRISIAEHDWTYVSHAYKISAPTFEELQERIRDARAQLRANMLGPVGSEFVMCVDGSRLTYRVLSIGADGVPVATLVRTEGRHAQG